MLQPFVTEEQLKTIASLSSSIESKFLLPYLQVAQEMTVVPLIGIALATELSNQLLSGNTSAQNQVLLNDLILPLQAYKAWELSAPFLSIKAYKKALVKTADPDSQSLSLDEIRFYKASITGFVNYYLQKLFDFLEADAQSTSPVYPLYRTSTTNEPRGTGNATSGFYFRTKI